MTLDEFIKTIGNEADGMTQEEIEAYHSLSVKLFNIYFDKWKKEKTLIKIT